MNKTNKIRIAHLAGPAATIQNTPPLVTSNKTGAKHDLPFLKDADGATANPGSARRTWLRENLFDDFVLAPNLGNFGGRSTMREEPGAVSGAPRSETNTNGDCSLSR